MQSGRHHRRPEEIDSRPDRHALGEDRIEKVVHHFQGSYKAARLYPLLQEIERYFVKYLTFLRESFP